MQTPDRGKLYLTGSVKFQGVARTEQELKYISKEDGSYDNQRIKELRAKHIGENIDSLTDPAGKAKEEELDEKIAKAEVVDVVQVEPERVAVEIKHQVETSETNTDETAEVDGNAETQAIIKDEEKPVEDVEEITLEQLQEKYRNLYEKEVPVAYKNNVERLAKKIADKN